MKALVFNLSIPRVIGLKLMGPLLPRLYYRSPLALVGLADVPEPRLPSPEWVKIRTRMCGFCGSDLNLIFMRDSLMASPFTSFPAIIGHELCGEVVETGSDVHTCTTGDLVTVAPMLGCYVRGITPECRACKAGRPTASQALNQYSVAIQPADGNYFRDVWGVKVNLSRLMNCPSQKWKADHWHYTFNCASGWQGQVGQLGTDDWTSPLAWKIGRYKNPAGYCTISEPDVQGGNDATTGEPGGWNSTNMYSSGQLQTLVQSPLHLKTINGLMMDGHVRNFPLSFVLDYAAANHSVTGYEPFFPQQ